MRRSTMLYSVIFGERKQLKLANTNSLAHTSDKFSTQNMWNNAWKIWHVEKFTQNYLSEFSPATQSLERTPAYNKAYMNRVRIELEFSWFVSPSAWMRSTWRHLCLHSRSFMLQTEQCKQARNLWFLCYYTGFFPLIQCVYFCSLFYSLSHWTGFVLNEWISLRPERWIKKTVRIEWAIYIYKTERRNKNKNKMYQHQNTNIRATEMLLHITANWVYHLWINRIAEKKMYTFYIFAKRFANKSPKMDRLNGWLEIHS